MTLEERLVELEISVTHQQDLLQQLSDVLYRQQREIDDLKQRNEQLETRMRTIDLPAE